MAHSIVQPLSHLHRGARALMNSPEDTHNFPLPVNVHNEIGDLIETFNRMVASLIEQRSGLNDTLSLLDSMLANAPIGSGLCRPQPRHRPSESDLRGHDRVPSWQPERSHIPRSCPQPVARDLENAVLRVFETEQPVRNLELEREA